MKKPAKITFLVTGLGLGGAELQAVHLAIYLKDQGHDVELITMLEPQRFVEELRDASIYMHVLGMQRGRPSMRAFLALIKILRCNRPDVLVCFMYHANIMGRIAGLLARVQRVVVSIRNEFFGGIRRDGVFRITNRLSYATVVNSQQAAKSLLKRGVVNSNDLYIIPNGLIPLTETRLTEIARKDFGIPVDAFVWLAAGRLEPQKDYFNLLSAFANLSNKNNWLLVAGAGSERDKLEYRAKYSGIGDRVLFLGHRSDLRALLQISDAVVLSSAWEGLPNILMEAHAASLPIVATDVGGVSEIVIKDISGLIVEPQSNYDLATAMADLAGRTHAERLHMGRLGHAHVVSEFELARTSQLWEELLVDV